MSYAVRKDGQGWRAVDGPQDCAEDENYSELQPVVAAPLWSRDPIIERAVTMRDTALGRLMQLAFIARENGDQATIDKILTVRTSLINLTKDADVLAATNDDDLLAVMTTKYATIAASVPAAIRTAFAGLRL